MKRILVSILAIAIGLVFIGSYFSTTAMACKTEKTKKVTDKKSAHHQNEKTKNTHDKHQKKTTSISKTETLRPMADIGVILLPVGETENWKCVDDTTPDYEATYVMENCLHPIEEEYYALTDHVTQSGTIQSVTFSVVAKFSGTGWTTTSSVFNIGFTNNDLSGGYFYQNHATEITEGQWKLYSQTYTTNPHTNSPWTWSDVDQLVFLFGIEEGGVTQPHYYITQAYATISYS